MIKVESLEKKFGEQVALNKISFSVVEKEIFGLLGPSGAGKTTLINILTGQLKADEGKANIYNQDCNHLSEETYKKIGMVLDKTGLYERISALQNLYLYADIHGIPHGEAESILDKVGLTYAKNTPVMKLSKGMKQRLTIARASLHKPSILFLDEPTSGLDPVTMKGIHQLIFNLRDSGTTVLLTTHNMDEATKLCDRVALLNEGAICECGSPQELSHKHDTERNIIITKKDGSTLTIKNEPDSGVILNKLMKEEEIQSIHSSEPSLENVFITLTGRDLQNEI